MPVEIDHAREGAHTFAECRIMGDISLVLCNFCQVDLDSIRPEYWGEYNTRRIGFADLEFVRRIDDVQIGRDKYCPECGERLTLLIALKKIRDLHAHLWCRNRTFADRPSRKAARICMIEVSQARLCRLAVRLA